MAKKKRFPQCPSCDSLDVKVTEQDDLLAHTCLACGFRYTLRPWKSDRSSPESEVLTLDLFNQDTNGHDATPSDAQRM